MMGQWMMSIGPVSYYLSNLSLNPPQQTK
jgi:hypothetical protein